MSRLIARLGLKKYDVDAPLIDVKIPSKKLKVMLSQGIGAPAKVAVSVGDTVKAGDVIGEYVSDKLSVSTHAPMDGCVREINEKYVLLDVSAKH
jgi:Na+-translocating ferredoxin:NAD+ oxidoreductase RnfC subunit